MEACDVDEHTVARRRRLSLANASLREKYNIIKEGRLRREAERKALEDENIRTLREYLYDTIDDIVDKIVSALGKCVEKSGSCTLYVVVHVDKGHDADYIRQMWKIVADDLRMSSYHVSAVSLPEVKYPLMRFSEFIDEPPGSLPQGEVKKCLKVSLEK